MVKPDIEGPGGCPLPQCRLPKDELYNEDLLRHLEKYHSKEDLAKYIFDLTKQQSGYQ
jgi:hypothetical protein